MKEKIKRQLYNNELGRRDGNNPWNWLLNRAETLGAITGKMVPSFVFSVG